MYWQKRFDRINPDKEIEEKILEVRKNNKDYGYRRIYGALRNLGYIIKQEESSKNYTKNQAYRLHHLLEKVENTIRIKEKLEKQLRIELEDDSIPIFRIKKSLQIQLNLNIMK